MPSVTVKPVSEPQPAVARRVDRWSWEGGPAPATANVSRFRGASGVEECHLVVQPTVYGSIDAQLGWVEQAYHEALADAGLDPATAVFRRFFCSDPVNQAPALAGRPFATPQRPDTPCAVSWVGQPPAPPAKVALWAYHISDPAGPLDKHQEGASLTLRRGPLAHHWTTGLACPCDADSEAQTRGVLAHYEQFLGAHGLSLADHVLRTWFFVQNVDANYGGLVTARRELFAARGLTADTHYIASTGIEGRSAEVAAKVVLDAYAVSGVRPEQIEHLHAPDHLSPTHIYGVTFERATALTFRDRRHVMISGTASIDRHGAIVHPGDVSRQLDRTLENVEALLAQAGATLADMGVFLVYVRDPSDFPIACQRMRERVGDAPMAVVVAPVCRPGWLIEVEGMALVAGDSPGLPGW
jgi:enamine deaminase RidA (YjgF/YER057c/UK114 family)